MFNEMNKGNKFDFQAPTDWEFIKLAEFVQEYPEDEIFPVYGFFFTNGKFGESVTLITQGWKINLPKHLNDLFHTIIESPEMIEAINNQKCGFRVRNYEDRNGITRYSIVLEDID